MVTALNLIVSAIKSYIDRNGGQYSSWYVGIASDPRNRLFVEHGVNETTGAWIYQKAETSSEAREIEEYLINTLGSDGGPGGGDYSTQYVYAYRKTINTRQ